ncbi:MAG: hypothetical protein ACR2RB_15775 [Gammaproteobacteria bacterium]
MPSTSEKQRRAMEAAAAGRSTLGIPQSVGKEFRTADRRKARRGQLGDQFRKHGGKNSNG